MVKTKSARAITLTFTSSGLDENTRGLKRKKATNMCPASSVLACENVYRPCVYSVCMNVCMYNMGVFVACAWRGRS